MLALKICTHMQYREVIKEAWNMTHTGRGLLWYGTIPAFFTTITGMIYAIYQYVAFRDSPYFGGKHIFSSVFDWVQDFAVGHSAIMLFIVIGTIIMFIGFFLIPPFCEAGLIGLISSVHKKKDVHGGDGLAFGFTNFLRMFEYRMVISVFSFVEFFTIFSLAIRNIGPSTTVYILFSILFLISLLFYFLFIYGESFIVLEKRGVIPALTSSARLVVSNLEQTLLMTLLMFLIFLRVILNVFLLFLIPFIVIFVTGFFVSQAALTIGMIVGALISLIVFALAAYLAGTLNVFTTAAWTITFLNLERNRLDALLKD